MARRWCSIPKTFFFLHLCEASDFDKGQNCWPPRDSVFSPMCKKRYISTPQNKEIGAVPRKTDAPMSFFLAPLFSAWIPICSMDAISRNPSYSASFSPLIFLLHYPCLISLSVIKYVFFQRRRLRPPTFESPWIHRGWTPAGLCIFYHNKKFIQKKKSMMICSHYGCFQSFLIILNKTAN